jgi:SPW repeat
MTARKTGGNKAQVGRMIFQRCPTISMGRGEVSIMRIQHWQDAASLLVGVWLVVSPFVLGFAGAAFWLTIAFGLGVILFAIEAFVIPSYLEEWGEMLLGLALVLVPWTVGYEQVSATVSSVLSGILVILLAGWELTTDREFTTWWHDRWHHRAG